MGVNIFTTREHPEVAPTQKSLNSQESKPRSSVQRWLCKTRDTALLKTLRTRSDSSSTGKTSKNTHAETVSIPESHDEATPIRPARNDSLVQDESTIAKINDNVYLETHANNPKPKIGTDMMPPAPVPRSQINQPGERVMLTQDTMRRIMESNKKRAVNPVEYQGAKKSLGSTVKYSHVHGQGAARGIAAPANPLRWSQD